MLLVDKISKSFGANKVLDNLSFTVKKGEIIGLLGPNGAGKTTTMRILAGFFTPDSGKVEISDLNVLDYPTQIQQIIGYLPENNPLYKDLLVADLLDFSLKVRGISGDGRKKSLDFAIENTNIADVYYRRIGELSKGYRQRVGIALCLLHQPQLLILDEPTEGLDPNQRTDIKSLIKRLSRHQTIIVSTHVLQEVEAICSRLLIIHKGRLVADGSPSQIIKFGQGRKQVTLQAEGNDLLLHLKKIKGVEKVEISKSKNGVSEINLTVTENSVIQPEISHLSHKYKWVIWKLNEEKKQLEDVFHELTK